MNKIYRLVFNRERGVMQVASELTASQDGCGASRTVAQFRRSRLAAAVLGAGLLLGAKSSAWAQDADFAAIFEGDYLMTPDTAAQYDWDQINTWGMIIGYEQDGHVVVRDGLVLPTAGVVLGHNAGVSGQLDLIGPGTTLTEGLWDGESLYVGGAGSGVLNVLDGAKIERHEALYIGYNAGSQGTANFAGAGSEAVHFEHVIVGTDGAGALNITAGAEVSAGNIDAAGSSLAVGQAEGSSGDVLVDGADSLLELVGNHSRIGDKGAGTLTVSGGGKVTSEGSLRAGYDTTGTGSIEVTGAGSTITSGGLFGGYNGAGDIAVREGARVEADEADKNGSWLILGYEEAGVGSLVVEGAGTTMDAKGNLSRIGYDGQGEMVVRDGASVMLGSVILGTSESGSGSLLVTGAGTRLATGDEHWVYVGNDGSGSFEILDGAEVLVGNLLVNADQMENDGDVNPTGNVLVSGNGSTLKAAGEIVLSNDNVDSFDAIDGPINTLIVEKGGSVEAGSFRMERDEDGDPTGLPALLRITGAGTRFKTTGAFDASTHFSLTGGALLETGEAGVGVTYATAATDKAIVSGTDTVWKNAGELFVNTALDIVDDAQVSTGTLGLGGSSTNAYNFDIVLSQLRILGEGSRLTTTGEVLLGEDYSSAPGYLVVADGGHLEAGGDIRLGHSVGLGFGTVLGYDDQGAVVTAAPQAPGTINADARIVFTDTATFGNLVFNHTSDDLVLSNTMVSEGHDRALRPVGGIVSHAGTTRLTGDLDQLTSRFQVVGGKLILESDVNVRPENYDLDADQRYLQPVDVEGGTLIVNGGFGFEMKSSTNDTSYGGTSFFSIHSTGTLGGKGAIFGNVEAFDGGRIAPGDSSAATLTINGDLTFGKSGAQDTTAFYDVDVKSDGASDKLSVSGSANLDLNGVATTVNVTALDAGTSYQTGQEYTILTADGGVEGVFDTVASNSAFLTPTLSYDANNVFLTVSLDTSKIDTVVEDGEVLDGIGPWASISVLSGGTLSPGTTSTPLGTMTVAGPVTFAAGAFYDVDIQGDGGTDLLDIAGIATLEGGTVRVTALDPQTSYQDGQEYTILTAAGGLDGEFAEAISRSAFLTPTLSYTGTSALLKIALATESNDGIVGNGEILVGNETFDSIEVQAGGTLSPGTGDTPIGTIGASGTVTFEAGSFFDVDIQGNGGSDLLETSGTATLEGGTVRVTALDPEASYQDGQEYTILTASGGLDGSFAEVLSHSAFIDPSLSYTDTSGVLKIALGSNPGPGPAPGTPPAIFQTVAESRNQHNVAVALNTLPQSGDALALYNRLLMLSADEARSAFGSLSGEIHASARSGMFDDRFVRDGVTRRLDADALAERSDGVSAWIDGSATGGSIDSDDNGAKAGGQRAGVLAGADWAATDMLTLGVAAGVEDIDRSMRSWQSSADINASHVGIYAAAHIGALFLRGGASHAWFDVDSVRQVAVDARAADRVTASYDASATTFFAEGAWNVQLGSTMLAPYLAVAHTRLRTDGTTEQGASTALHVAGSKDELLTATAGVRASWDIGGPQGEGTRLTAGLGWQNANGELKPEHRASLVAGGDGFTVYSAPLGRNTGIAELGLSLPLTDLSHVQLGVQGRFGDGQSDAGGHVNWTWRF